MITKLNNSFKNVFELALQNEIVKHGTLMNLKENDILINIGTKITTIPLVLNGAIKILREDDKGDEIILYFLNKGDTCAISLNCLKSKDSKIKGVAEKNTEIIYIPTKKAEEWLGKYKSWREFVIENNSNRLDEMIEVIDTIAFMNMDERLIKYLKDKSEIMNSKNIITTHKIVATDLNTSRVVISRLLKKLEKNNKIKIHRNMIEVFDI